MTRILALLGALAACSLLAVPGAEAKKAKGPAPVVKRVTPMRVTVGKSITIRGLHFSSRKRTTVVFRAPSKRVAFAKPRRASGKKLVVKVPASIERLLLKSGKRPPTRFKLRIVTKRYGKLTSKRLSPVIVSGLKSGALGAACGTGSDWDGDYLSNAREAALGTDPCLRDTDLDGAEDGFEVQSALDVNPNAVPSTHQRPFPNALFSDGGQDYDGDGLSNAEESTAWAHPAGGSGGGLGSYSSSPKAPVFGGPFGGQTYFGNHVWPPTYSDGKQQSVNTGAGSAEYRSYLDLDGDGRLTDDERDVDGDGLRNIDEIRLMMYQGHYPPGDTCGYEYKPVLPRSFQQVDWLNSDSDGDGIWDGNDDQDTDGVSNADEVAPPYQACENASPLPYNGARDGSPVLRHPYNPCLPDPQSDTCRRYGLRG